VGDYGGDGVEYVKFHITLACFERLVQLKVRPRSVDAIHPSLKREDRLRIVVGSKEEFVIFIEEAALIVRYIWSLAVPRHKCLP
jgi:hypothetical protein